jgi:hypothetical protein
MIASHKNIKTFILIRQTSGKMKKNAGMVDQIKYYCIYLHIIKNMRNIIIIVNVLLLVVVIKTPG